MRRKVIGWIGWIALLGLGLPTPVWAVMTCRRDISRVGWQIKEPETSAPSAPEGLYRILEPEPIYLETIIQGPKRVEPSFPIGPVYQPDGSVVV